MSKFRNQSGFIVIALWMLGPLGALLDFHHYRADPFFWASAVMLLLLIAIAAEARSNLVRKP
jgi:hypothetical protein